MICKIIGRKGQPGSGAGADAFDAGVRYVCSKADAFRCQNLTSGDWQNAASEMVLTSQLSKKVEKPYYHLALSWHEHERPTNDQMFEAIDILLSELGLGEHQAAIGIHRDTERCHIHAIINTVHPVQGKAWSKSNDMAKAELACRKIEARQGWTVDRGRFDAELVNGEVVLTPKPPEEYKEKSIAREAGRLMPPSPERSENENPFGEPIIAGMKAAFAATLEVATDWQTFHAELEKIGLKYEKFGSGARVGLIGTSDYAKASAFGSRFSIAKIEKIFGQFQEQSAPVESLRLPHIPAISVAPMSADWKPAVPGETFQLRLLKRVYVGIYIEESLAKSIRYVDLANKPPQVSFKDGSTVVDHGQRLTASQNSRQVRSAMIAMAKAKGWPGLVPSGSEDFVRQLAIEAAQAGLSVSGVPAEVQEIADAILEQTEKSARRNASIGSERANNLKAKSTPKEELPRLEPRAAKRIEKAIRENDRFEIDDMKSLDISIIADAGGWSDVSRTHGDSSDKNGQRYRIYQRGSDTIKASLVDGKWLWKSNKSGNGGSVIDLWLYDNQGKSLGDARSEFRDFMGKTPTYAPEAKARPKSVETDHTAARRRWEAAPFIGQASSYAEQRGISRKTLLRFSDQVRIGPFGGTIFAHRNEHGDIQGFEQRWDPKKVAEKRFAAGGLKSLCILGDPSTAQRVCIVEGGLDALALAEIEQRNDTLYVSTGGGFGARTKEALARIAAGKVIVSAFDNDVAGDAMHQTVTEQLPSAERLKPRDGCKDWLVQLNAMRIKPDKAKEINHEPYSDAPQPF